MDGKRNIKRGEVVEEKAAEKTVTLPDGRVITIPSDGRAPGGRGMRPMGGNKKATTSKKDSVK